MQQADRPDFEAQFRKFCAGANIPATDERIEAFWTGLAKMALSEFTRATDHMLGLEEWSFPKKPGALWGVVRELKAQQRGGTQAAPIDHGPKWHGDKWDEAANTHLMAYVMGQAVKRRRLCSRAMLQYPMPAKPDQESVELMHPLLEAKRAWAEDMRDLDQAGGSLPDHGRAIWQEYIDVAEKLIALVRERYAVDASYAQRALA